MTIIQPFSPYFKCASFFHSVIFGFIIYWEIAKQDFWIESLCKDIYLTSGKSSYHSNFFNCKKFPKRRSSEFPFLLLFSLQWMHWWSERRLAGPKKKIGHLPHCSIKRWYHAHDVLEIYPMSMNSVGIECWVLPLFSAFVNGKVQENTLFFSISLL